MKYQKVGQVANMLASPISGITKNVQSTCRCQGMSKKPSHGSNIQTLNDCNINHSPMFPQNMVKNINSLSLKMTQTLWTRKLLNSSKKSPAYSYSMPMPLTAQCSLPLVPLHPNKLTQPNECSNEQKILRLCGNEQQGNSYQSCQ